MSTSDDDKKLDASEATPAGSLDYNEKLDHEVDALEGATFAELRQHKGPVNQQTASFWSLFAGAFAFVTDGYQNSLLTTGNLVFAKIYGSTVYDSTVATRVSNALLVGTILGQFSVGLITDRVGRRTAIIFTTCFIVVGGILGTVAHAPTPEGLFWFLTVARGIVGLGAGGEYPATSAQTAEGANQVTVKNRASTFVYFIQFANVGGQVLTVCVFLFGLGVSGYNNDTTPAQIKKLEIIWRCEWAVGVILPLTVFYYRMKLLDSKAYQKSAIKQKVPYWLFIKRYWPRLIGTSTSWFVSQFIGTAAGTFSSLVIGAVLPTATTKTSAEWQLFLIALALPSVWAGGYMADKMPRNLQIAVGFGGYVVFGAILAGAYTYLVKIPALFFVLYALFNNVSSFGPGNLNGLLLVESYPTAMRGTVYGCTAAFGKLGGICGTYAFVAIKANLGVRWIFGMGSILAFVAVLITYPLIVDKRGVPFSTEDEDFKNYLRSQGYNGDIGESDQPVIEAKHIA